MGLRFRRRFLLWETPFPQGRVPPGGGPASGGPLPERRQRRVEQDYTGRPTNYSKRR